MCRYSRLSTGTVAAAQEEAIAHRRCDRAGLDGVRPGDSRWRAPDVECGVLKVGRVA